MRTPTRFKLLAAGTLMIGPLLIALSCGANDVEAPKPPEPAQASCRSFDELMPRFTQALETGRTENLRLVIKNHLAVGERSSDDAPPMAEVLRAVFQTLGRFAAMPPEQGAPEGETCATTAPPVAVAHPICEMRRAMDVLVHDAKGLEAIQIIDPLVRAALDYVIGRPPSATKPHYEVATVLSGMCQQNVACQMNDTLDLVIAFSAWLETDDGRASLDRINALINNPALQPFLNDDGAQYGGENGIVALANLVITTTLSMQDPSELDNLPLSSLPEDLQPDIQAVVGDLKKMLDPNRQPNILAPMKKALNCYDKQDRENSTDVPRRELIRMVYRLGFDDNLPEFGITRLVGTAKDLRELDQRGTLIHLVGTLAQAVRSDETAVDAAAQVCHALFATTVSPGETKSPAELALPDVADLYRDGVTGEAMCAADTLLYGCAGGAQPACEAAQ